MSVPGPQPTAFPQHTVFTSTLHETNNRPDTIAGFSVWIVILTAVFFFLVLSWYNFLLALYNYLITDIPRSESPERANDSNFKGMVSSFGFALIWTLISIFILIVMAKYGMLTGKKETTEELHPLLRSDVDPSIGV